MIYATILMPSSYLTFYASQIHTIKRFQYFVVCFHKMAARLLLNYEQQIYAQK